MSDTLDKSGSSLKFFLADVEAFARPVAIMPDIGRPETACFVVEQRSEWKNDFVQWLQQPHKLDTMLDSDNECDSASDKDVSIGDEALEEGDSESKDEQTILVANLDKMLAFKQTFSCFPPSFSHMNNDKVEKI